MSEADAINKLRRAGVAMKRSQSQRVVRIAIGDARAGGLTDGQIAAELNMTPETVLECCPPPTSFRLDPSFQTIRNEKIAR